MNFKNFLKNSKNVRKIFGKKEIEIILKQLEGITLTQSEKNRLSRDIRPKLKVIKELSEFKDEFELKKDADTMAISEKAVSNMLGDKLGKNIKAIMLFGSHVDGNVTKRSDIDLCALFDHDISLKEAALFRLRVSRNLPEKADVQVFNVLPQKIKRAIAKKHKILYTDKNFDNTDFTIRYLKDEDYFIRMQKIFGEAA
ncbi:MAG: nucleotidyltransferase domain-containing protein [Nanoarchaeota archaeon]|nr:nucleotidyltransferase domain-containing protein [Nanoarchaeota archaeon]